MWLIAVILLNIVLVALQMMPNAPEIGEEHGPLEMAQLVLLAVTIYYFVKSYRQTESPEQVVGGAMAILGAAAFVREVDVRSLGGPEWFRWLAAQSLQEILLIGMSVPALVYVLRNSKHIPGMFRLAFSWVAWPMWLAAFLVFLGIFFDSRLVRWYGPQLRIWEELIETNGYILLLVAAKRHLDLTDARTAAIAREAAAGKSKAPS